MKVAHVITGLGRGGAETMLYRLLRRTDPARFSPTVFSLTGPGPVGEDIAALGVAVRALDLRSPWGLVSGMASLVSQLRALRPDVVQTWMYHADLAGGIAARLVGAPAVWGIRNGTLAPGASRFSTRCLARLLARLSRRLPARIVSCSASALEIHAALGYDRSRMAVIPNGFDLDRFHPDPDARRETRRTLGVAEEALLVGMAARFHPQKDHRAFFAAAARAAPRHPSVRFLLCGEGVRPDNPALTAWAREAGVAERCLFLGPRADIEGIMPALDVLVSSSRSGEAFPGVVGEAMSCGVPCVVTDVGDSAMIVGSTGRVVPPGDPAALAAAMAEILSLPEDARRRKGLEARRRIEENFSLSAMSDAYASLYHKMVAGA